MGHFDYLKCWSTDRLRKELRRCESSEYLKLTNYRIAIVEELKKRKD